MTVETCPDRGTGNPKALVLAFHQGPIKVIVKLLQTWLIKTEDYESKLLSTHVSYHLTSVYTMGKVGLMICLSQGGLCAVSASSSCSRYL